MGDVQVMCTRHPQEPARYKVWFREHKREEFLCKSCLFSVINAEENALVLSLSDPNGVHVKDTFKVST